MFLERRAFGSAANGSRSQKAPYLAFSNVQTKDSEHSPLFMTAPCTAVLWCCIPFKALHALRGVITCLAPMSTCVAGRFTLHLNLHKRRDAKPAGGRRDKCFFDSCFLRRMVVLEDPLDRCHTVATIRRMSGRLIPFSLIHVLTKMTVPTLKSPLFLKPLSSVSGNPYRRAS